MATQPINLPVEVNDPDNTSNQMTDTNTEETPDADGSNRQFEKMVASLFEDDVAGLTEGLDFSPEVNEYWGN
jgi:hypothetical protein